MNRWSESVLAVRANEYRDGLILHQAGFLKASELRSRQRAYTRAVALNALGRT